MKKRDKKHVPITPKMPKIIKLVGILDTAEGRYLPIAINGVIEAAILNPTNDTVMTMGERLVVFAEALTMLYQRPSLGSLRDAASVAVCSGIMTYKAISQRHDRTQVIAITPTEAMSLRAAWLQIRAALEKMPAKVWLDAEFVVKQRHAALAKWLAGYQQQQQEAA